MNCMPARPTVDNYKGYESRRSHFGRFVQPSIYRLISTKFDLEITFNDGTKVEFDDKENE